ncbi:MAG: hypothetical protein K2X00_11800 [Nitrospiraceae bacterium]|nr:hypothetical protein [Nitrospiraceae bacterium]
MKKLQALVGRILVAAVVATAFSGGLPAGSMSARASETTLQERGDALMKNVEDMMAHGGMGDAKAIVHHCGEAAGYAEAILKQLPDSDPRRSQALAPLTELIHQCKRVSDTGIHADPGQLLNPASKARAAARTSIKALGLAKTN